MKRRPIPLLQPINFRLTLAGGALLITSALHAFQFLPKAWVLTAGAALALETFITAARIRRRQRSAEDGLRILEIMVGFLESLNRLTPALDGEALHRQFTQLLSEALRPMEIYSRVWLLNNAWKTLKGEGDHPALRPGSPSHLPIRACPAFALRRSFTFHQGETDPCPSEQFNYAKHLCVPVAHEMDCYGVLFLGSYKPLDWSTNDRHLFQMIGQAMALALQRRATFAHLQEKIAELNTSFEVGATALASFVGSTQSLDETTIHILDGVRSMLKVDRASLMLWDNVDERLHTRWVRGGDFLLRSPLSLQRGEGMAGWALETGQPYWAEYAMGDPHYRGSAQAIQSLICVPIFTVDQQPLGVINAATTHDPRRFTEQEIRFVMAFARQAAMAIENARLHHRSRANIDQLNELNRMKSQFLSLVSHDLRGPLTGIRGFCEVLKEQAPGELNASQLELLEQMEKQVELQERMVDDLLDFARMEKNQLSIEPVRTELTVLLREEVEKSQRDAREKGIALQLDLPHEDIPAIFVDAGRIRQVLWNLIHNALKFTPEGGRIEVRAISEEQSIRLDVQDTGVGLSEEAQEKIFEKFFQVTPGGSRGSQGLGLGLAICKEIVQAHHGRIQARSPGAGRGTTMTFWLPLNAAASKTHSTPSSLAA